MDAPELIDDYCKFSIHWHGFGIGIFAGASNCLAQGRLNHCAFCTGMMKFAQLPETWRSRGSFASTIPAVKSNGPTDLQIVAPNHS